MSFIDASNKAYAQAVGTASTNAPIITTRNPDSFDTTYPIGKFWINTQNDTLWYLNSFSSSGGVLQADWINISGNVTAVEVDAFTAPGTNPVLPAAGGLLTITGGQVAAGTTTNVIRTDSLAANEFTIQVQRSQAVASSTIGDNGVSHFDSSDFSVDSNGFVTFIGGASSINYTNVTSAMSPYTVLVADQYISVDCSIGSVQLNFPNSPTAERLWIIKDRTGNASLHNITLTTPGGTVTFDGLTTYTMNSNYQAINLLANATPTYEVY